VSTIPESHQQCTSASPDNRGYEVTTSSASEGAPSGCALLTQLESYVSSYVTFADTCYALVIALWVVATYVWIAFDAFPYLTISSATKRSGKTRLLEIVSFVASNSRLIANISPAALYRTIDAEKPTLLVDEAEMFSSAKSEYRSLLNAGYRRGQTVKRRDGDYETYCPKAFALIGDVHDTTRDRSIVIEMRRREAARRFVYAAAREEGAALRDMIGAAVSSKAEEIAEALRSFEGLSFLTDRDEEIWTPLFVLCRFLCPDRIDELTRAAADLSAAKTAKARRCSELGEEEDGAQEAEYAVRLLRDMLHVVGDQKQITTQEAIAKLREILTSPWRRFRGDGLKDGVEGAMVVAGLLSRFGVKSSTIRIAPKSAGTGSTLKGYRRDDLLNALAVLDGGVECGKGTELPKDPNDIEKAAATQNRAPATDREPPTGKDVNVIAKESIRQIESARQTQKLEITAEKHNELNPTIRQELIRASVAHGKKLLGLAEKLKKDFNPLPVDATAKAHQRVVREHRATLLDPLLDEKRKLATDFTHARVEQIPYDTAKNVVLANEYLGSMGSVGHCFGLYFGEHLGSVVCFGSVAGTKVAASVCGPEYADKVTVLVRGATEPWAHKHSASHLIAKACDLMAAKGLPITIAYSDPAGGEVGQIYSAVNFLYTGMTAGTEVFITPDGKKHNSRQIHGLTRDRRNGEVNYKRTRAEQKKLLIEQGCSFERVGGKHRFVLFSGDRRTKRLLRKALKWQVLPHPRREAQAVAESAPTVSLATHAVEASAAD
jgi:hypothetical protein